MLTRGGRGVPTRSGRVGTSRRLLATALPVLLALLAATAPAAARRGGPGAECPPGQDECGVWDDDPGTPGGPGGGGNTGGGGDSGGGGPAKCQWNGRVIPCYDDLLGWFNSGDGCYYKLAEPQPADTPEGKQWYVLTCNGGDLADQRIRLLDAPPPGYGAPPDPEELARRALAEITLAAPRIAVAPRRSEGPGLVGLPVWLWTSRGGTYWGPQSASESERGLTVWIRAKVDRAVWDLGNGDEVTCTVPGTPYDPAGPYAGQPSPDCGYDDGYPRPGTYQVRVTTYWTVEWWTSSDDDRRQIPQTRTSGVVPVEINELQVVTQ